jgi:hypothetical protein
MLGHVKESSEFYERALVWRINLRRRAFRIFCAPTSRTCGFGKGSDARAVPMLEAVVAHGLDGYPSLRQSQLSFARLKMGQPHEALGGRRAIDWALRRDGQRLRGRLRERARAGRRWATSRGPADINDALDRSRRCGRSGPQ